MQKHPKEKISANVALAVALAGIAGTGFCGEADRQEEELDAGVVLGEEDLAERAEIARNMFRRITPGDEPFVQDVGTWPVAWEEFPSRWDGAATGREYGAWVVPVSVEQENGATVIRDADNMELWRGTTDFAKEESAIVTLTGGLVSEEEWDGYEAVRDFVENASRQDAESLPSRGAVHTNGLRFTSVAVDTNGTVEVSLAWEEDGDVDVFAYLIPGTSGTNVVTWTNDENQVVTTTNTVWSMAGPNLSGFDNDWEWRGTASVSNGVGVFTDAYAVTNPIIMGFYAAAEANDTDGDGLNDGMERFVHHTDPDNEDTDGDGWTDGEETTAGTNPLDRLDASRPARGVLIHAVKYSTDTSNQWVQLHCSGPRGVDVGGFRLQTAGTNWEAQVVLPEGTWMSPGHFLLVGGEGVTNADVTAELALAGTISNAPTAGVRLMPPEGATNGPVDVVMYAQNLGFNGNGLDTTGWLSQTTNLWASSSRHLARWNLGDDTDRENDWRHAADGELSNAETILDSDGDGLTDQEEYEAGYNPLNPDMDDDGLLDGFEANQGLEPTNQDSDGDGTPDGEELDPDTAQSYEERQRADGVTVATVGPDSNWRPGGDLGLGGAVTYTLTDIAGCAVYGTIWEGGAIGEDYLVSISGAYDSWQWELAPSYGRKIVMLFAVPNGTNAVVVAVTDNSAAAGVTDPDEQGADITAAFRAVRLDVVVGGTDEDEELQPGTFIPNVVVHTNAPRKSCVLSVNRIPVVPPSFLPGTLSFLWDSSIVRAYPRDCQQGGEPISSLTVPFYGFGSTNLWLEGISTTNDLLTWQWDNYGFCRDTAKITVYEVRFQTYPNGESGPDKAHELNISTRRNESAHYHPFQKCASHVQSASPCDLTQYLEGHENQDLRNEFRQVLRWRVGENTGNGTWISGCELPTGSSLELGEQMPQYLAVAFSDLDPIDYLILTVVPQTTVAAFQQWFDQWSTNTAWWALLPAPYSSIAVVDGEASDPEGNGCDFWKDPEELDTYYHPDGCFEMRSKSVSGEHGHQAVYSDTGDLILSGPSSGSADWATPEFGSLSAHRDLDVRPYIWAAQLDGNPVQANYELFPTDLIGPMMYFGVYLNRYLECRPPVPNGKPFLQPGTCPQNQE